MIYIYIIPAAIICIKMLAEGRLDYKIVGIIFLYLMNLLKINRKIPIEIEQVKAISSAILIIVLGSHTIYAIYTGYFLFLGLQILLIFFNLGIYMFLMLSLHWTPLSLTIDQEEELEKMILSLSSFFVICISLTTTINDGLLYYISTSLILSFHFVDLSCYYLCEEL